MHTKTRRPGIALVLDGLDDGRKDRAKCVDASDLTWYQRLAFDAMTDEPTRADYFNGYIHGLTEG